MSEDADNPQTPDPDAINSLLGGLDLTPDWARENPGIQSDSRGRDQRDERRGGRGGGGRSGPRAPGASARRGLEGVRVKPRRDYGEGGHSGGGHADAQGRDDRYGGGREGYRGRPFIRVPVHVDFIPEKERLSKVVKVIRKSNRVYPMDQIAGKFMEAPGFLSIKYTIRETERDAENFSLFQCTANGLVFSDEGACIQYILERGLGEYYESKTLEVAPPTGNFICVGRHRSSGKLVGPPNWHGYQRNLETLRQELAPQLPPDAFANQIEMVHDAEVIEAWRASASQQIFYRRKQSEVVETPAPKSKGSAKVAETAEEAVADKPEATEAEATEAGALAAEGATDTETPEAAAEEVAPEAAEEEVAPEAAAEGGLEETSEAVPEAETASDLEVPEAAAEELPYALSREAAEASFMKEVVPGLMSKLRRAIMPGYLLPKMTDEALLSLTEHHLNRERDRPASIVFALRPAFKHMRLHLFRYNKELMVSGIAPHPLPEDQNVAPEIRRIVDYVAENAGVQAKAALEALAKDATEPTPALVSHMHWLIEKGHLLELFDGSLVLPPRRGN